MNENRPPVKKTPATLGLLLILIGAIFIMNHFWNLGGIGKLWPLFFLIPVVSQTGILLSNPKENVGMIMQIVMMLFFSVYFLWLNYNGWWLVSRTWPNFILAPGLGFLCSWLVSKERLHLISGFVLVLIGFGLYSRIIMGSYWGIDRIVILGIILVVLGVLFLFSRRK